MTPLLGVARDATASTELRDACFFLLYTLTKVSGDVITHGVVLFDVEEIMII